jgi:class 3 adenylate cyclase/tetratricopeptide (TPR) repeat protein
MRCAACNRENRDGRRFCAECGVALSLVCAGCGAVNNPDERFCGRCGSKLIVPSGAPNAKPIPTIESSPSELSDGERKTVTALFADIKGSMDLIEDLDPEEARGTIDPALQIMAEAVLHYGGHVVQSTGDGVFALFGAPVAYEDHAQRALYAALRMQEEVRRHADRLGAEGKPPVQVRLGINTGEAVLRTVATGASRSEYTPVGYAVSLAARIQGLAPIGSIAVAEPTQKLCEGYFTFKAMGARQVKGATEPVNMYEVTGLGPLRTRLQRSASRGLTKFVGREAQMATMRHALDQTKVGHGQVVGVVGEAGVGKSRLFHELKTVAQDQCLVLETFSVSHGKATSYLPIAALLTNYFEIASSDDQRKRREKVTGKVLALDRKMEDTLPVFFALLAIAEAHAMQNGVVAVDDAPRITAERTVEAIARLLLRESTNQLLMIVFEDLHWIDSETQAVLDSIVERLATAKILLLVNYRPEYSHQWSGKTYYTHLRLEPLGKENASEMLDALLPTRSVSEELNDLKRQIIERTEGNAFFMEEMVQGLLEQGVLERIDGAVVLKGSPRTAQIPATVKAMLAARIDRLSSEDKALLQTMAVVGREFPAALLQAVASRPEDELNASIAALQNAEFVYEQPAPTGVEYVFKHALTQEVAYGTMLIESRKGLHERTGQAIETLFHDRLTDHYSELAHHYVRSGNVSKAIEYLHRSGQQAAERAAYGDATAQFTSALKLLGSATSPDPSRELAIQIDLGESLRRSQGPSSPETERAFARALELCHVVDEPRLRFRALLGAASSHTDAARYGAARDLINEILALAEQAGDREMLAAAYHRRGFSSARLATSRRWLERALSVWDSSKPNLGIAFGVSREVVLSNLALVLARQGYADQARNRAHEVLESQLGAAQSPVSYQNAASVYCDLRDAPNALRALDLELNWMARHGFIPRAEAGILNLRAWALAALGRREEAQVDAERALSLLDPAAHRLRGIYLMHAARTYIDLDNRTKAMALADEAIAAIEETRSTAYLSRAYTLKAELLAGTGSDSDALEWFRKAIDSARPFDQRATELSATTGLARLLAKQGKREDAQAMLSEIYSWFTEGFDTPDLKDAKALLDELSA